MRISGGKAKGIPLKSVKSLRLRPASESSRERLFSSLFPYIKGSRVLDLFAGTGSYGLESLSRGALDLTLVEKDLRTFEILRINLANVLKSSGLPSTVARLQNSDVLQYIKQTTSSFDFVFIDPPYNQIHSLCPELFKQLLNSQCLLPGARVILESPGGTQLQYPGWKQDRIIGKERKGSPVHRIYRPDPSVLDQ